MSYSTKPCFVGSFHGWDNEALNHPAMKYLSDLNIDFCETKAAHSAPHTKWGTQDWEFQAQSGQVLRGEEAWKRLIHTARFYDKFSMEPLSAFIQDTADGYDGIVFGNLYTNFVEPGEKKHSDSKGNEWELRIPRAYRLTLVKDSSGPHGLKLSRLTIVGDIMGTMAAAVRKGLVSQEDAFGF
ncbi:hypothetical protein B0J13DRAFT_623248 [Dactylonectria estremocensis]|uniref:Uncharacterized protein n=1 Tax=Dactylonectria estremocensis TaxID=1079267 RepID=A0A9P9ESC9_9HYPO|nr:hypothetical protein B0J13DRAFT_623248 [Dactylonectria estremocensis]